MSKYGVFSGLNTGKYGPEKTPYLDTFHAVKVILKSFEFTFKFFCKGPMSSKKFKDIHQKLNFLGDLRNQKKLLGLTIKVSVIIIPWVFLFLRSKQTHL